MQGPEQIREPFFRSLQKLQLPVNDQHFDLDEPSTVRDVKETCADDGMDTLDILEVDDEIAPCPRLELKLMKLEDFEVGMFKTHKKSMRLENREYRDAARHYLRGGS